MKAITGEQKIAGPRSADAERRALIRAYAEHGQGVPPELEAQKPRKTSDKNTEEEQLRKATIMSDQNINAAPAVNSNPSNHKDNNVLIAGTKKLSRRALERTVDGGVLSLFALATVTGSALIVRKING